MCIEVFSKRRDITKVGSNGKFVWFVVIVAFFCLLKDKNLCIHCPVPSAQSLLPPGKHAQSNCIVEKIKRAKAMFFPLILEQPNILYPLASLPRERNNP
jgi:hypothetical protein